MPKFLTLGNGNMLIGLDRHGQLYDLYFPYVGLENHVGKHYLHKIGVWSNDQFSWLDDGSWEIGIKSVAGTLSGEVVCVSSRLGLKIIIQDTIYNEKNVYLRHFTVKNLSQSPQRVKIFLNHQFEIYASHRGDTAFYDPKRHVLVHYKGRRLFLANLLVNGQYGINEYSVGLLGMEGKEGTYKDAEDGQLSCNPIEHGLVDSVCVMPFSLAANEETEGYYWLVLSKEIHDLYDINQYVMDKSPGYLIESSQSYWRAWGSKEKYDFYGLEDRAVDLFRESLFIIRAHLDNNGGIIASSDSDMLKQGRDTYCYVWPRDGAFTALALDKAQYTSSTKLFFDFCANVIAEEGYLRHKYHADGSIGSSWHPWMQGQKAELPIQEDETALVLIALWSHFEQTRQIEELEAWFNPLIRRAADFMSEFVDQETGLPHPSYDLWEQIFGVSTFTCAAVAKALEVAAKSATILGKTFLSDKYNHKAQSIRENIFKHLYREDLGYFLKTIEFHPDGTKKENEALDLSSFYAAYKFGLFPLGDERLRQMEKIVENKLLVPGATGGYCRFEDDDYFRAPGSASNPWIITTLWMAQYKIASAKSAKDFDPVLKIINWVTSHASGAGILSEQLSSLTGEQFSAAPLTWSHAEYVVTILDYLKKIDELGLKPTK